MTWAPDPAEPAELLHAQELDARFWSAVAPGHPAPCPSPPLGTPGGQDRAELGQDVPDVVEDVQSAPDDGRAGAPADAPAAAVTSGPDEQQAGGGFPEPVPGRRGWLHSAYSHVSDTLDELPAALGDVELATRLVDFLVAAQADADRRGLGVDLLDVDGLVAELTIAATFARQAEL